MLWHPRHMATLASIDVVPPAAGAAAGAWALAIPATEAAHKAMSEVNSFFIFARTIVKSTGDYMARPCGPPPDVLHEIPRLRQLRCHAGPHAGGQRRRLPPAP